MSSRAKAQIPTPQSPPLYRGRFAPSPTGNLHFGSLVAAVGSYLQARVCGGEWLVRIEDVDIQRAVPGAADEMLRTLESLGFEWDGAVVYQSRRTDLYEHSLATLREQGLVYDCSCSRTEIEAAQSARTLTEDGELRYPGTCRNRPLHLDRAMAARLRVPERTIGFVDRLQGSIAVDLTDSIGDFVIKRRDGLFAYQLAVVVDDHAQAITEVVRGADLLYNTPRQIALQAALGFETPEYVHLPVATDEHGRKLSKSTAAFAVALSNPVSVLWQAFEYLNQAPAPELKGASVMEIWQWAKVCWKLQAVAGAAVKPAPQIDPSAAAVGHCTTNALL